jgi:hypothetical protein
MKDQEKLAKLREYAEKLQHKLAGVPAEISQKEDRVSPRLDNYVTEMRKATEKIIESASSPVKIAIVGEFNGGKTTLIGSLLGYADALPISENPTTGNVTAIHLVQQEELRTSEVGNCTVEYLDEQGIKDCLNFMLQEAEKRAKAAQIVPSPKKLSSPPQSDELTKILQWCETAWNSTKNPELRYLLRELVGFIRIVEAYKKGLCGKTYTIDNATAKEGLKLANTSEGIQAIEFHQLPNAPHRLSNPPQQLNSSLLQKSFPLIRRLKIEFKISKEIWDLSALKGVKEFILLDFPGLGAANSGVRDTFLSLQELAEVQTILILLDGRRPGSGGANQIFTIMQQHNGEDIKDRILVGIGRFDQLPVINEGGEQIIDELIANDSDAPLDNSQITEATVLEKLTVLQTTIAHAKGFTLRQDRIVFLSPILALSELATRFSQIQVGSETFIKNLNYPGYLEQSNRFRSKWRKLSQKIQETQPKSPLAKQLGDFANDGGVGRMRELILTHVAEHGLRQLYQDTQKKMEVLRQQQEQLKEILASIEIPIVDSPSLQILRQSLDNLIETYTVFQRDLGKKPLPDRRGIPVDQIVKDEVIFCISNWSEWTSLFNQVKDGTITVTQTSSGGLRIRNLSFPKNSEDFYGRFSATVKELEKFSIDTVHQAFIDILDQLSRNLSQIHHNLQPILNPEMEQKIEENFGVDAADSFYNLVNFASDPKNQWLLTIFPESEPESKINQVLTIDPEAIFPLALSDHKCKKSSQSFDWTLEKNQGSHTSTIIRLKDTMNKSSQHFVQLVNQITQQVNSRMEELLKNLIPTLQQLSTQEELLRYIAGGEKQEQATPIWLQILSEIAEIAPPDLR